MAEPVRVALLGCGNWGSNLLRALVSEPGARVVCVIDPDSKALGAARAIAPHAATAASLDALGQERAEAVVIASPGTLHAQHALRAIESGAHVFIEKPMALCVADASRVARAAQAAGLVGMVGHLLHYHPAVRAMLQLLREHALGKLVRMSCTRSSPAGSRDADGSVLWSLLPHDVSLLRAVDPSPLSHLALHATGSSELSIRLELRTEAGLCATLAASRTGEKKLRRVELTGERGSLVFDDVLSAGKLLLVRGEREERVAYDQGAEPLRQEMRAFLRCVRTGEQPATDLQEGLSVVSILCAARP